MRRATIESSVRKGGSRSSGERRVKDATFRSPTPLEYTKAISPFRNPSHVTSSTFEVEDIAKRIYIYFKYKAIHLTPTLSKAGRLREELSTGDCVRSHQARATVSFIDWSDKRFNSKRHFKIVRHHIFKLGCHFSSGYIYTIKMSPWAFRHSSGESLIWEPYLTFLLFFCATLRRTTHGDFASKLIEKHWPNNKDINLHVYAHIKNNFYFVHWLAF